MKTSARPSRAAILLALTVVALLSATPGIAATARPAATPIAAVRALIVPFTHHGANNLPCNAVQGKLALCPVTSRLRADVARDDQRVRREVSNVFCRCETLPQRVTFGMIRQTGSSARVPVTWIWTPSSVGEFTLVVRHVSGGWLVDNEFCTGHPATDLYHVPIGPCPTSRAVVTVKLRPVGAARVSGTVVLTASGATTHAVVSVHHLAPHARPYAVIHAGACSDLGHLSASSLFLPALKEDAHGTAGGSGRVHGPDAGGWNQDVKLSGLVRSGDVVVISTRAGLVACGSIL